MSHGITPALFSKTIEDNNHFITERTYISRQGFSKNGSVAMQRVWCGMATIQHDSNQERYPEQVSFDGFPMTVQRKELFSTVHTTAYPSGTTQ